MVVSVGRRSRSRSTGKYIPATFDFFGRLRLPATGRVVAIVSHQSYQFQKIEKLKLQSRRELKSIVVRIVVSIAV